MDASDGPGLMRDRVVGLGCAVGLALPALAAMQVLDVLTGGSA